MREQRHAAVMVEIAQEPPEQFRFVRELFFPSGMTRLDGLGRSAVLEARSLHGWRAAFGADLQTAFRGVTPEDLQHQGVQRGDEGDIGIVRQRITQCERAVCGQFHDQALRERLEALVVGLALVRLRFVAGQCRDGIDGPCLAILVDVVDFDRFAQGRADVRRLGFGRRLVLGPDIAPLDLEPAVAIMEMNAPAIAISPGS